MKPDRPDPRTLSTRASQVVLAAVLVMAVSGYFMGLQQTTAARARARAEVTPTPRAAAPEADASGHPAPPRIVEYRRLGEAGLKPNAAWRSHLASLGPAGGRPPETAAAPAGDLERARAVELRAARRAFDGAPPVIPHPVDPGAPVNCMACHGTGLAVRDRVAPKMSHREMGSCTQCHVPLGGPGLVSRQELPEPFEENSFDGLRSAGRGARAWPGAPPTIPHTLWMRQDCASCHGPNGLAGLRTSHPERTLCQQCHVPDGAADLPPWLRPELAGPVPPGALNAPP